MLKSSGVSIVCPLSTSTSLPSFLYVNVTDVICSVWSFSTYSPVSPGVSVVPVPLDGSGSAGTTDSSGITDSSGVFFPSSFPFASFPEASGTVPASSPESDESLLLIDVHSAVWTCSSFPQISS